MALDADAVAYADAVVAAGGTVSAGQRTALSDFVTSGKTSGWWSLLKRLRLTIWAVENANEVDLVTTNSATTTATVTQAAGYVQGNGTSGYMTDDASPNGVGMTDSTGGVFALCYQAPSGSGFAAMAALGGSTTAVQLYHNANNVVATIAGTAASAVAAGLRSTNTGIYLASRTSPTALAIYRRNTAGFTTPASSATSVSGNSASAVAMTYMSQTAAIYSDGRFGAFGMSLGMDATGAEAFTLALKTLWETCTGLTLP